MGEPGVNMMGREEFVFLSSTYSPTACSRFNDFLVCSHIPMKACIFIRWLPSLLCFCMYPPLNTEEREVAWYGRNSFLLSLISCLEIEGSGR